MSKAPMKSQEELREEVQAEIQRNSLKPSERSNEKYAKTVVEKQSLKRAKKDHAKFMLAKQPAWGKRADFYDQKITVW